MKMEQDNNNQHLNKKNANFYGVYVPVEFRNEEAEDDGMVFQDKIEALRCVKSWKKARFKAFTDYDDAVHFAKSGLDTLNNSFSEDNGKKESASESASLVGEKPSPFKGPKSQDLVKFRKAIETGDVDKVYTTIWENPRYLVSSGDTPSILQEGSRYNALHIAAKARNSIVTDLILKTISNIMFIKFLYGDCALSDELANERVKVLVDLYLNTPDKGLNETPLHFAVKFGAVEVVEVLLSYPQCDKTLKNKFGKTPDMIICDRYTGDGLSIKKNKIALLLEGSYYVPVLRAEDNSVAPKIGEPFSPSSPPVLNKDPLSPRLEIRAYAGPFNKKEAEQFRRVWKTPPRTNTTKEFKTGDISNSILSLKYKDPERGLERFGNSLATKYDIGWKEYWPFLDSFVDISSPDGLQLLENHLATKLRKLIMEKEEFDNLAVLFKDCNLSEKRNGGSFSENHLTDPFLCLEKACQVFANRITSNFIQIINSNNGNEDALLSKELNQNENFITSYFYDIRFTEIDFHLVHPRLGALISKKITELIEKKNLNLEKMIHMLTFLKENKGSSLNVYAYCLLEHVLKNINEDQSTLDLTRIISTESQCKEYWNTIEPCTCYFDFNMKTSHLIKQNNKRNSTTFLKKFAHEDDLNDSASILKSNDVELDSDSEDFFYTPSSSPVPNESEDSDGDFKDVELFEEDIFIEGPQPTKTDHAVFTAIKYANCDLNKEIYPNVYRWYHAVNLFSPAQRKSWTHLHKRNTSDSPRSLSGSLIEDFTSSPFSPISRVKQSKSYVTPKRLSWNNSAHL